MKERESVFAPNIGLRFPVFLANAFSFYLLLGAVKSRVAPVRFDETGIALGMFFIYIVPIYMLIGLGAFRPYSKRWRSAFISPLLLYFLALAVALVGA